MLQLRHVRSLVLAEENNNKGRATLSPERTPVAFHTTLGFAESGIVTISGRCISGPEKTLIRMSRARALSDFLLHGQTRPTDRVLVLERRYNHTCKISTLVYSTRLHRTLFYC